MGIHRTKRLRLNQSIGGFLGTSGGAGGTGFKGPASANIQPGVSQGQITNAYGDTQQALASQQMLLQALGQQGNLQNQQNAFGSQQALYNQLAGNNAVGNQAGAMNAQQALNSSLVGANGIGAQTGALSQQQALNNALASGVYNQNAAVAGLQGVAGQQANTARQYQDISEGRGPNPALAALHQATGENVANQAALMAGQRGAGANVGLIARQAAQQGANTQQQAVGQGATLQAQQQMNALSGLSAQQQAQAATQAQIGNLGTTQAGMQQAGIGQQANIGAGLTGAQQAGVSQQGSLAAQQLAAQQAQQAAYANQANLLTGQQISATQNNIQGQQAQQQMLQNALGNYNNNMVGMQGNINSSNAGLAQTAMGGQKDLVGGVLGGAASGIASLAQGGEVKAKHFADGGDSSMNGMQPSVVAPAPLAVPPVAPMPAVGVQGTVPQAPQSKWGKFLSGALANNNQNSNQNQSNQDDLKKGMSDFTSSLMKYAMSPSKTPASPETAFVGPDTGAAVSGAAMAAKGGEAKSDYREAGGKVKAHSEKQKAVKSGNSYSNDKIPAYLSEGEIVLPREVTQSDDPVRSAADFVSKVLAKKGKMYA